MTFRLWNTKYEFTFHFHSWRDIQVKKLHCFLGKEFVDYDNTGLRICKKCGIIQEYAFDSQGGSWNELREPQQTIASNEIVKSGNRFIISKNPYSKFWCDEPKDNIL